MQQRHRRLLLHFIPNDAVGAKKKKNEALKIKSGHWNTTAARKPTPQPLLLERRQKNDDADAAKAGKKERNNNTSD